MGLESMRHEKTTGMPVVSLSKAKDTQVVTAAPGVTEVKRSALRAATRFENQKPVVIPRMTEMNAMASSKQGQSSTGDGCWLTKRRRTSVTVKGAAKKCKHKG